MRKLAPFLLAAGLIVAVSAPAVAAPPSSDPATAATYAATWLAHQVSDEGFVTGFTPGVADLSNTAQAVTALAAAGVGRPQVDAMLGYLAQHVDDFVVRAGADDPGALGYLILAVVAGGKEPTSFGAPPTDLVARLQATQQASGLFGSASANFDGATRQGLALMALKAVGLANPLGVTWLQEQQCADGSWTAFRADTAAPCPPVDLATFSGPDTNSSAFAMLGLHAQGATAPVAAGVTAMEAIRNAGGGWGFLAAPDQDSDANSTGLVLDVLRAANGVRDAQGTAALLTLQAGCDSDPADQGGIAFLAPAAGALAPDILATVQALPALAGVELPIPEASIADALPDPCAPPPSTTSTTVAPAPSTTVQAVAVVTTAPAATTATTVRVTAVASGELPRTGGDAPGPIALGALMTIVGAAAGVFARSSRRVRGSV